LEVILSLFFVSVVFLVALDVFKRDFNSQADMSEHFKALVKAESFMEEVALEVAPRSSSGNEVLVENTDNSDLVTVNISWADSQSEGNMTLVREFFYLPESSSPGGGQGKGKKK
jgi:hypothetical protein